MSYLLENEEEELIEHFLRLAIEDQKAAASVLDQEVVEIQDSEELKAITDKRNFLSGVLPLNNFVILFF